MRLRQLLVASALASMATAARAEPVRLEVQSSAECVSHGDLVAKVLERSGLVRFVDGGATLVVRARFEALPSGEVSSILELARPGRSGSTRRFTARTCAQAAEAAALIIVVTVGRESAAAPSEPSPGSVGAPPAAPVSRPPVHGRPKPALGHGHGAEPTFRVGAHFAGQLMGGPAPGVMPGAAVHVLVGLEQQSVFSPALVLGGLHAWKTGVVARGGTAAFMLDAVSLDLCPFRLRAAPVAARACASTLGGRLAAQGSDTLRSPGKIGRPFWMVGGAALLSAELGPYFEAVLRGLVGPSLVRDSFTFTPVVFHRVSRVTASASIGIGLRLP